MLSAAHRHRPRLLASRQGATTAARVDFLFNAITSISIFSSSDHGRPALTSSSVPARPGHAAQLSPVHNQRLEITWTVIPL
jgi:heme/copper-type cytochrome/quinol oxidase subunit 2